MASDNASTFWTENLQESIQAAARQSKTLLCFITNDTELSTSWEHVIGANQFQQSLQSSAVCLRLRKDTQEFGFLNAICPIQHAPALVLINGGQIEEKLESPDVSLQDLQERLEARFASESSEEEDQDEPEPEQQRNVEQTATNVDACLEFAPSTGRMRLPNNAYDSLRERTEKLRKSKISAKNILALQLRLMDNIPALKSYVQTMRSGATGKTTTLPEDIMSRLLNTPASMLQSSQSSQSSTAQTASALYTPTTNLTPTSSSAPSPPPEPAMTTEPHNPASRTSTPQNQRSQRADYIRQQREHESSQRAERDSESFQRAERDRESSQRAERDRIKAQIKADREERRRLDAIRKQSELETLRQQNSTTSSPASTDIRIQVRTFDGSTLRTTFPCTATIMDDVRPWIARMNQDASNKTPYDLKVILTPLPNRTIEASEEGMELPELGIVGSATLVMVPVKGFVDSYAGGSTGVAGSVIGGIMGAGGSVVNGVLGLLGWGASPTSTQRQPTAGSATANSAPGDAGSSSGSQVKVRTLADQRADENKRRGNQLYNGNSLDFQGRKDAGDDDRKQD